MASPTGPRHQPRLKQICVKREATRVAGGRAIASDRTSVTASVSSRELPAPRGAAVAGRSTAGDHRAQVPRRERASVGEVGSGPGFVSRHVPDDIQPGRSWPWIPITVIDLRDQRPVLQFIYDETQAVALNDIARLAKRATWQDVQQLPFCIIEIDRRASNLARTLREPDLLPDLPRNAAIRGGHLAKPQPAPVEVAVHDVSHLNNPFRDPLDEESTLTFDDRVLQRIAHINRRYRPGGVPRRARCSNSPNHERWVLWAEFSLAPAEAKSGSLAETAGSATKEKR
jgi:hypothetical protein